MLVSAFMYICKVKEKETKWNGKEMNMMKQGCLFFIFAVVEKKKYEGAFK